MGKSVKVHDDTHRALKQMKSQRRCKSIDEVIRDMIRTSTGTSVARVKGRKSDDLTKFLVG